MRSGLLGNSVYALYSLYNISASNTCAIVAKQCAVLRTLLSIAPRRRREAEIHLLRLIGKLRIVITMQRKYVAATSKKNNPIQSPQDVPIAFV